MLPLAEETLNPKLFCWSNSESKKLRRSVLRGAIVVVITAGYSGKRFIYERAKELGVRSVILDGEDRCAWPPSNEKPFYP